MKEDTNPNKRQKTTKGHEEQEEHEERRGNEEETEGLGGKEVGPVFFSLFVFDFFSFSSFGAEWKVQASAARCRFVSFRRNVCGLDLSITIHLLLHLLLLLLRRSTRHPRLSGNNRQLVTGFFYQTPPRGSSCFDSPPVLGFFFHFYNFFSSSYDRRRVPAYPFHFGTARQRNPVLKQLGKYLMQHGSRETKFRWDKKIEQSD